MFQAFEFLFLDVHKSATKVDSRTSKLSTLARSSLSNDNAMFKAAQNIARIDIGSNKFDEDKTAILASESKSKTL